MSTKPRIYWFDTINHPLFSDLPNSYNGAAEVWTSEETSPGTWSAKSLFWDSFANPPTSPAGFVAGGYGQPNARGPYYGGNLANLGGGAISPGQAGNIGLLLTLINYTLDETFLYSLPNSSAPPPVSTTALSAGGPNPVGLGGSVVGGEFFYQGYWWIVTFSESPTTVTINVYSSSNRVTWTVQDTGHALVSNGFTMYWTGVDNLLRLATASPTLNQVELIEFQMSSGGMGTWGTAHSPITTVGSGAQPVWISHDPTTGNTAVICTGGTPNIKGSIWLANLVGSSWTNVGSPACDQSLTYQINDSFLFFAGLHSAVLDPTDGLTIHTVYSYNDSDYNGSNPNSAFNENRYAYSRCSGGTTSNTFQFDSTFSGLIGSPAANRTGLLNSAVVTSALIITSDNRLLLGVAYRKSWNTGPSLELGAISTAISNNNGSGYNIGDKGQINGYPNTGDEGTIYTVTSIGAGGSVTGFTFDTGNRSSIGYVTGDNQPTQINTGSGDGNFTVNITAIEPYYGNPTAATVVSGHGGTGYALGDTGWVLNGTQDCVYTVTGETGGVVTSVSISGGTEYPGAKVYGTNPKTGSGDGSLELALTLNYFNNQASTVPAVWSGSDLTAPSWSLVTVDNADADNVTAAILQYDESSLPPATQIIPEFPASPYPPPPYCIINKLVMYEVITNGVDTSAVLQTNLDVSAQNLSYGFPTVTFEMLDAAAYSATPYVISKSANTVTIGFSAVAASFRVVIDETNTLLR